jgi:cell division septation protein DedD
LESSEREPSYYEVALTHRQVMVGLVVALTTVVVAFFAGIWIGRDQSSPPADDRVGGAASVGATSEVEKLTFFGDEPASPKKPAVEAAPIAPSPSAAAPPRAAEAGIEPSPGTVAESESAKLRQTLEAEMAANRVDGGEAPAITPGARVSQGAAPAAVPAPERPAATPATGTLWIQVYSSSNGDRAREISTRLEKGGFSVRTLAPAAATGSNYRVRVGPYPDRSRAERAATRLRREFKLDTWITDSQ